MRPSLTIVADLKALDFEGLPLVLKNNNEKLSAFPNWNNLFKAGDLCECEHCRSVLSPAAYFADLLMFLKDRNTHTGKGQVKDVLFRRRPDLGFLELNCANALTPFPYIDTVCEVLEDAVDATNSNDLELTGFATIPVDAVDAKAAVADAVSAAFDDPVNMDKELNALGDSFSLSQVNPPDPDEWVVHGDDVTYRLKKPGGPNFFAEILRNTKASAAELRAYPQYVNPKAYEKLREAKYPLTLPFDLFAEEVRAAFQKCNLQRWDLMRTLRGTPNNPTDGEIAAEYFSISASGNAAEPDEKSLILVADATIAGQQTLWGESGASWLIKVGNVKNFLQKTGLEYNELVALLDLKFLNPAGDINVHHLDASCDTDKKVIQVLNAKKLDRIHRFLRLWRKLQGWKMWELDLVIRHPRVGDGALDEPFLINLFYFGQLRSRLGGKATVERVCALLGDLNTETRFTKLHEKREDALYQNLFLNRRLIKPLDQAFQLDPGTGDLPAGEPLTAHHPVIQAALGIREADLTVFEELTKPSDGSAYIADEPTLTLSNLSFLWRHAWLSKQLKVKAEDWKALLKIFNQDIPYFTDPQAAAKFVETIDQLKATGFAPDELNWLLSADRSAKSAVKEADAARFLAVLRKELQALQAEYDPGQYDFLSVAPPIDLDSLTALLTSLLQKLNRDEAGIGIFLKTLRGSVLLEAGVQGVPPIAFPIGVTTAPNHIPIKHDPLAEVLRFTGVMTDEQRTVLLSSVFPAALTGNPVYTSAIEDLYQQSQAAGENYVSVEVDVALPNGVTLPGDRPSLPIRYNSKTQRLGFTGVMTNAERLALNAAGNPAGAVDELFRLPRLAVKFFAPVFTAPLDLLPPAVDFKAQLSADLAGKISYDVEQRLLVFAGFMNDAERSALDALVPNVLPPEVAYHIAVNSLATQPQSISPPDDRIWLTDDDLDPTLPDNGTLAERMGNAAKRALDYLSRTLAANGVVRQSSAALGLTEALTRRLLTSYAVLPDPLLKHLTNAFATTTGVVDYATLKTTFDGWFWANRAAAILKKWKITLADLENLIDLTAGAQLLDLVTLPLDDAGAIASLDRFVRTHRLIRLRDSLPETKITFFEVLEKLNSGVYATEAASDPSTTEQRLFAADVELLNEAWLAADVEALTAALNLTYPAEYLLSETWERIRRAFYFLDSLNAHTGTVTDFAASAMSQKHGDKIKELLRSKFGTETWLTLCAEIQDVLRERKRDALAAYLLTQKKPDDAPSGKWENTNDLYAYYLLDVEMSSCQLTSRLVQGSGSVQLFVQRCFMGLEGDVVATADGEDGDSAWRWWKWMRKYRVWEANRKVFLWPENWIEPELKKDRSSFFKDLENELLQNDVDQYTAETAFSNYLEKLDGVAQLEVAGFYQEDDGDDTIIHVFGRTKGAEPHLYYYRRYDYRQWTPWEKVDLDIQGDYLSPAVLNKRLFLFWPVFTEVPDEDKNSGAVPIPSPGATEAQLKPTYKTLNMQLAASEYRHGKWMPKRISKDSCSSMPPSFAGGILKNHYRFIAVDGSDTHGRFWISPEGFSDPIIPNQQTLANVKGSFELGGCKGVPELATLFGDFANAIRPEEASVGAHSVLSRWIEVAPRQDQEDDFTLQHYSAWSANSSVFIPVLGRTPGFFRMMPPWHLSYFDRLWLDAFLLLPPQSMGPTLFVPIGLWVPFFYYDRKHTFFVLPCFEDPIRDKGGVSVVTITKYYPDKKRLFQQAEDYVEEQMQKWLDGIDFSAFPPAARQQLEQFLQDNFQEEDFAPPYSNAHVKDLMRRFLMRFVHRDLGKLLLPVSQLPHWHFKNFYHPFVCDFAKLVNNPLKGVPGLMSRNTQLKDTGFSFQNSYRPTDVVLAPSTANFYPKEVVDFAPDGAYASYNWELFFHAPLLIANSLSVNQRFEEARNWYHFIFNPIGVESATPGGSLMSKYWITKPFFETTDVDYIQQRIENIMRMLAGDTSVPGFSPQMKKDLEDQVRDWRTNPFEPHRIANYRTVAYQKTVVMKYLDNLIAWGDYLFRQDSMESINEATQLYVLAAEILGPRPRKIPPQAKPPVESFNELEDQFDKFSNALVEVENLVPQPSGNGPDMSDPAPLPMLYFCIPQNDKLLGYWDTVADRLYKIRHCMNIEGVVRQLALFEPPIDPGALVKAVAGGLDISSALADLNAPLPLYRFNVLLQKANDVCSDVKALGGALLAALEKKDAEALSLLRQSQEIRLLEAVKAVREKQIDEAKENLEGVRKSKLTTETRRDYYRDIEKLTAQETLHLDKLGESHTLQERAQEIKLAASIVSYLPAIDLGASGFGGSPIAKFKIGGLELGQAASLASDVLSFLSQIASNDASMASSKAGFDRRWSDWRFQERLAEKELDQLDRQIASADLRIAIAEKELDNHILQTENAMFTDAVMRSKFTNEDLYQWQVRQIAGVYFQSYKLAYDLAKRAERCFRFELGPQDSGYVNFGYWDSLKQGLLSAEMLQYDLRRLETAYLEQNRREFELTKHISLALLDPLALVKLRETGRCFFNLPEEIFDLDYPGHYFRRVKSVSITLPCVVGPYTTVACTLRLLKNSIRTNTTIGDGYPHNTDDGLPADDDRFIENNFPVKSIAASSAQNDSGVFELSFRDERYLPFEGAGAISEWSLELFSDLPSNNPDYGKPLRQFDYGTISDAILHVKYTAREDAGPFKNEAIKHLREYFSENGETPSLRMFNLRKDFPSQWHRFLKPTNPDDGNVFELEISPRLFSFRDADKPLKVNAIWLMARCTNLESYGAVLTHPSDSVTMTLAPINQLGGLHFSHKSVEIEVVPTAAPPVKWQLKMTGPGPGGNLQEDPVKKTMEVEDVLLVLGYQWDE